MAVDHNLQEMPPQYWQRDLDQALFPGGYFKEFIFFHRSSRTLIVADTIINLELDKIAAAWVAAWPASSACSCGQQYSIVWAICAAFATSIRPRPRRRHSSTHERSRSWALIMRPRMYSASPQRFSLKLRQTKLICQPKALAMLLEATLDVAAREVEIAAQKVNVGLLVSQLLSDCNRFGALKVGECTVEVIDHVLTEARPIHARHRSASSHAASSVPS
ncbi:hypothetical protein I6F26_30730 [Ensifer sp. IC3342]|nr:hypothetical protein [Ensifer sp. BRP08]MCA1450883.1 hypothetical protein [Ensifer sp. IC3342]